MTSESGRIVVTGAIVAGGRSRRMGDDKRAVLVDGVPMLRRVAVAVRSAADELVIACRAVDPPQPGTLVSLDARLVFDRLDDAGPLAGVEAALAAARGGLVLIAAGDMPWLEPAVLRLLVDEARRRPEADAVVLRTAERVQPLLGVYHRDRAVDAATRLLDAGHRAMHVLLDSLVVAELPIARWQHLDPSGRTAANVNEAADLGDYAR